MTNKKDKIFETWLESKKASNCFDYYNKSIDLCVALQNGLNQVNGNTKNPSIIAARKMLEELEVNIASFKEDIINSYFLAGNNKVFVDTSDKTPVKNFLNNIVTSVVPDDMMASSSKIEKVNKKFYNSSLATVNKYKSLTMKNPEFWEQIKESINNVLGFRVFSVKASLIAIKEKKIGELIHDISHHSNSPKR